MALVLLSPLNTLATHGSSVASSWVSTGLTFSFPPKPPLTQNPSFTEIHGPHPTAQLPAVNPIPLHSEESDRTTREAGERESAGTPRPPRFVEAAGFEARAHPPLLPRLLDPGSRGQDPAGQRGRTASVWTAPAKKRFAPSNARCRSLALEIRSEVWRQRGAEQRAVTAAARARGRERPKVPRCGREDGGRGGHEPGRVGEPWKSRGDSSPSESPEGSQLCSHLDCSLGNPI